MNPRGKILVPETTQEMPVDSQLSASGLDDLAALDAGRANRTPDRAAIFK